MQEQIEAAKGRDVYDYATGSDTSSDEDDEVGDLVVLSWLSGERCSSWHTLQGEFFTEGPETLLQARRKIARYSLSK